MVELAVSVAGQKLYHIDAAFACQNCLRHQLERTSTLRQSQIVTTFTRHLIAETFVMHSLFATSGKGLFAFTLTGDVSPIGLQGTVVSQTSARNGVVLAAAPVFQQVHKMMSYGDSDSSRRQPGLYMFDLSAGDANGKHVYSGNVKSCAIGKESANGKQRWYAGTEPADVVISDDMGATWANTDSFKAVPARDSWYDSALGEFYSMQF